MVRRSWKEILGNTDAWSRPCDRLVRTAVLCTSGKHLFEFAVFSCTSPDGLYLGEIDSQTVRQWGTFSKQFPSVKALLLRRSIVCA